MLPLFTTIALGSVFVVLSHLEHKHARAPRAKPGAEQKAATIAPADYLAALLINEVPFPGEPAFKSADDSKAAMRAILHTLHNRRAAPPQGYTRWQVAATSSSDLIDIITAFNQMDGFFKDKHDRHAYAPRVAERMDYLRRLAQRDDTPTLADLLAFAQTLALDFAKGNPPPFPDPFAELTRLPPGDIDVTGSCYGWMTDDPAYNPGGNYVRIPDEFGGALGGNRFYTLRKTPLAPAAKEEPTETEEATDP